MHRAFHNLVQTLSKLPGIGQRSALRIGLYLIKSDERITKELSKALLTLKQTLRFCQICGGITEHETCEICVDSLRDPSLLCVVEEPGDIFTIEKTGEFSGHYHVLMGVLSPLDGIGPDELRLQELIQRVTQENQVNELFIATNPTVEGDTTADYISNLFTNQENLLITRISHGIPTGSVIEFAEPSVLARSIRTRMALK